MTDANAQNTTAPQGTSTQLIDLGDDDPGSTIATNSNGISIGSGNNISSSFEMSIFAPQSPQQGQPQAHTTATSDILLDFTAPQSTGQLPDGSINGSSTSTAADANKGDGAIGNTDFFDFFETSTTATATAATATTAAPSSTVAVAPAAGVSTSALGSSISGGAFHSSLGASFDFDSIFQQGPSQQQQQQQLLPPPRASSPCIMAPPGESLSLSLLEGKTPAGAIAPAPQQVQLPVAATGTAATTHLLNIQDEKCDLETLKSNLMTFKANSDKNGHYLKSKSKL